MQNYFADLLEQFNQADNRSVKNTIYDAMVEYADSYHPGYTCYDMDMFVALYKCARTNKQRKHALKHIQDIIVDDSYQYHDELIKNFKEFTLMKEFLNERDEEVFDALCKEVLDFFVKQKEESEFEAGAGQGDFVPDVPVWKAHQELKEVAEILVGTDMHDLESYEMAVEILGIWKIISRERFSRLFFFEKVFKNLIYSKYWL